MSIRVSCPSCQKSVKAPDHYAGRVAKCPGCQAAIKIPDQANKLTTSGSERKKAEEKPRPALPPRQPEPLPPAPVHQAQVPMQYEQTVPVHAAPPHVQMSVDHSHIPKRGFFSAGFGSMFGCLMALLVFGVLLIGGCVMLGGFMAANMAESVNEGASKWREEMEVAEAERQREREEAARERERERERELAQREQQKRTRADSVRVLSSSFELPENSFSGPVFNIEIRNDSDQPLTRVFFHCRVTSPGRSVPWGEGDMNYAVPGGVEPGEVVKWRLSPSLISDLYKIRPDKPVDLELTVTDVEFYQ